MSPSSGDVPIGPFRGIVAPDFHRSDFLSWLGGLPACLPGAVEPDRGARRSRIIMADAPCGGRTIRVAVKSFRPRGFIQDAGDRMLGSRSRRSWDVAQALERAGVGTPRPLACLDRWAGRRLAESHYVSACAEGVTDFREELIRLYTTDALCRKLMTLLECVACGIRQMHDAGVFHGDLGNQNILLRRAGDDAWRDVQFVDLNRGRVAHAVSLRKRAIDISRISLPSDFLRVFKEMDFADVPPPAFQAWERWYRRAFSWHTRTRVLRHPLRVRQRAGAPATDYPHERDLWVWDDRSAQPVSPMIASDRRKYRPLAAHARAAMATVSSALPVARHYRALLGQAFAGRTEMLNRIGVAVAPAPDTFDAQAALLQRIGTVPVMIRLCRHDAPAVSDFAVEAGRRLRAMGHSVSFALVQDRQAVLRPELWTGFVARMLDGIAGFADWIEVGHATNRSKWGIWTYEEYGRLAAGVAGVCARHPGVKLMGPACIDFEYPQVLASLSTLPDGFRFQALSHHLYVDRRGAPENRQGAFSALEKFALARAIACAARGAGDRLVVSEVNWPIAGTGVYSPVGAPYESPGPRHGDPSVNETVYAEYMLRYLLLAVCSGLVDRVYWWRLVARGFGLVDEGLDGLRERPAYKALCQFVSLVGRSTFVARHTPVPGASLYEFEGPDGVRTAIACAFPGETTFDAPFEFSGALDMYGNSKGGSGRAVSAGSAPVYLLGVTGR